MQAGDEHIHTVILIVDPKNCERLRMDIYPKLSRALVHQNLRCRSGGVRQCVRVERGSRNRSQSGFHLSIGRSSLIDREVIVRAIEEALYLRMKEEDCSGHRKPEHEWNAEEASIKVPPPHGAVIEPFLCRIRS